MALETSGFQLQQFDRAPQVPGSVGVVDTKEIYGSVIDALRAHEALRTTQQMQAQTDAESQLATAKARADLGLVGPEAEARRLKAQLFAAGAPYEANLLGPRATAERAKLGYETALSTELGKPENVARMTLAKTQTKTPAQLQLDAQYLDVMANPSKYPASTVAAAQSHFKLQPEYVFKVGPDGAGYMIDTRSGTAYPAAVGTSLPTTRAFGGAAPTAVPGAVSPTADMGGRGVLAAPTATSAAVPVLASQTAIPTSMQVGRPIMGTSKQQQLAAKHAMMYGEGTPLSMVSGEAAQKEFASTNTDTLKDAQKAIRTQHTQLDNWAIEAGKETETEAVIDQLIKDASEKGVMISGGGLVGAGLRKLAPGEEAAFRGRLAQVLQQIQLGNMLRLKNASATGATGFGNLTENEGKVLRSDYGDLENPNLSSQDLVATLERAKKGMAARRQEALSMIQSKLDREREAEYGAAYNNYGKNAIRMVLPVHANEEGAPASASTTESALKNIPMGSVDVRSMEAAKAGAAQPSAPTETSAAQAAPAINFGETPAPEAAPLVPAAPETPAAKPGTPAVTPGTAPSKYKVDVQASMVPATSVEGAAQRLKAENTGGRAGIVEALALPGRMIDETERLARGVGGGLMTGKYEMPEKGLVTMTGEKIGEMLSGETVGQMRERFRREDEILRTRPNSWAAYDIRRDRGLPGPTPQPKTAAPAQPVVEETVVEESPKGKETILSAAAEVPQIPLSKEARDIVQRAYDQYAYNKGDKSAPPVLSSRKGGAEKPAKLDDRTIWAILTNPADFSRQIRDEGLRGEFDMAATRALNDIRMQRAMQMRAYEAANPRRGR